MIKQCVFTVICIVSIYGYVSLLTAKIIKPEIALGLTFSAIGAVMFVSGVVGLLVPFAWAIFAGGLLCLIYVIATDHKVFIRTITPGTMTFLLGAVLLLLLLYAVEFIHYDNFSHWAIAAKLIINKNRFPVASDPNIMFSAYPLGSASFIYYFSKITGITAEWFQSYVQALLILGMLVSLFALTSDIKGYLVAAITVFCLMLGNTGLVDLLVDTLLPSVAISCYVFCRIEKREKYLWMILIYLAFLIAIKNSGIYFVLILLFGLYMFRTADLKMVLYLLGLSALILIIWHIRVFLVFHMSGLRTKHAMSLINLASTLYHKSMSDIWTIIISCFKKVFSFHNRMLYLVFFLLFTALSSRLQNNNKVAKKPIKFILISYTAYLLGLLGMYLCSMPTGEAVDMAGFERYHRTIIIFVCGVMAVWYFESATPDVNEKKKSWFGSINAIITVAVIVLCVDPDYSYLKKQELGGTTRDLYDSLIAEYEIIPERSYYVIDNEDKSGYLFYMTKYLLNPEETHEADINSIDGTEMMKSDYVIVVRMTDDIENYLKSAFGDTSPVIDLRLLK